MPNETQRFRPRVRRSTVSGTEVTPGALLMECSQEVVNAIRFKVVKIWGEQSECDGLHRKYAAGKRMAS
jgi:hypothetical protein